MAVTGSEQKKYITTLSQIMMIQNGRSKNNIFPDLTSVYIYFTLKNTIHWANKKKGTVKLRSPWESLLQVKSSFG